MGTDEIKPPPADYYVMQDEDNTIVAIIDCRGYAYNPVKRAIQAHLDAEVTNLSMGLLAKDRPTTIKVTVDSDGTIDDHHTFTLSPAVIFAD